MKPWYKLFALLAATVGLVSAELLMHWVFNLPSINVRVAGLFAGISLAEAFTRTFAKDRELYKRFRYRLGAMLWLLPQTLAFLTPNLLSVSLPLAGVLLGSSLIWRDDWQEKKARDLAKMLRDPAAIPLEEREQIIRVRIAEIQEQLEPRQDELADLKEELHTLEQKKGYRGK